MVTRTRGRFWLMLLLVALAGRPSPAEAQNAASRLTTLNAEFEKRYVAGDFLAAEQVAKQMLAMAKNELVRQPGILALALNNLGVAQSELGNYDAAVEALNQALAIRDRVYGPAGAQALLTRGNLAAVLQKLGRYDEAAVLQRQVLRAYEQTRGGSPANSAIALNNLGLTYRYAGKYAEAEPVLVKALDAYRRAFGARHANTALCLNNLALLYDDQGFYDKAICNHELSLEITQEALGGGHPQVAVCMDNLAVSYQHLGRYREALEMGRKAVVIREKALGPRHPEVSNSLNNLATLFWDLGRMEEAEQACRRALTIKESALPTEHPELCMALNNLANLFISTGKYWEAEPLLQRAIALFEKRGESPALGLYLSNLAVCCNEQGRNDEAIALYDRASSIQQRTLGPKHPDLARTLSNFANALSDAGRIDEAMQMRQRTLGIREQALGPNHVAVASDLNNIGLALYNAGRAAEAGPHLERAATIIEQALGKDHAAMAAPLHNLALVYSSRNKTAEAERLFDRCVSLAEAGEVSAENKAGQYQIRAVFRWSQGRREEALNDMRKAIDLYEEQYQRTAGGEHEAARQLGKFLEFHERMIGWLLEMGRGEEAFEVAERVKARSLLNQIELRGIDLLAGLPPDDARALWQQQRDCQTTLAGIERRIELLADDITISDEERAARRERLADEMAAARQAVVDSYAQIRNASPTYRATLGERRQVLQVPELEALVASEEALLLYYVIGREACYRLAVGNQHPAQWDKMTVDDELAVRLGIAPGPLTAAGLAAALQIEDKPLLSLLSRPETAFRAEGRLEALWDLLIPNCDRAALASGQVGRLIIVPDGLLATFPFDTLVVEERAAIDGENLGESGGEEKPATPAAAAPKRRSESRFLLDVGPPIEYAPSATILHHLKTRPPVDTSAPESVLTVGDPAYSGTQSTYPSRGDRTKAHQPLDASASKALDSLTSKVRYLSMGGQLSRLPHSGDESRWVAEVFAKRGVAAMRLTGQKATEANVRSGVAGRRIVHLACHGLADQAHGNFFGALALAPVDSNLPENDGFLSLPEIYALNLSACELAILSACETNFGPRLRGEGVWALSRGCLVAGARRVVASNWVVDDEAGASLISYFCSEVARQQPASDYAAALRSAKRWVRRQAKWQSPYYWGTFVLIGPQ